MGQQTECICSISLNDVLLANLWSRMIKTLEKWWIRIFFLLTKWWHSACIVCYASSEIKQLSGSLSDLRQFNILSKLGDWHQLADHSYGYIFTAEKHNLRWNLWKCGQCNACEAKTPYNRVTVIFANKPACTFRTTLKTEHSHLPNANDSFLKNVRKKKYW